MASSTVPTIERRPIGGRSYGFSAIALDLAAVPVASAHDRGVAVAELLRARAVGVTTFDLVNARDPPVLERLLAEAFPSDDPDLVTILGVRGFGRGPASRSAPERPPVTGESASAALRTSLAESLERLGRNRRVVVDWRPRRGSLPSEAVVPDLLRLRDEGVILDVAVGNDPSLPGSTATAEGDIALASVVLSLLETDALGPAEQANPPPPYWIARDVFAEGRLDGSAVRGFAARPGPGAGPHGIRDLQEAFEPVLRLGFLTETRRRTMAQAALRFVLGWPWVVTASVPMPPPERFEEILGYAASPPLERVELARVLTNRPTPLVARRTGEGAD